MNSTVRNKLATAMMLLAPLGAVLVAQPASAQYGPYPDRPNRIAEVGSGTIRSMSVHSNAGLRPGASLRVQVYATPGARWANVTLAGSGVRLALHERSPGEYVGTHVIRRGERIDPTRTMTVRAGWGYGPAAVAFNYPPAFQALATGAGLATTDDALVTSFVMRPTDDLEPGSVVRFRLEGTPGARAWVNIPDVVRGLPLREVRPGVYVGRYAIRRGDDPEAFYEARAVLRSGSQRAVTRVNTNRERFGYGQ